MPVGTYSHTALFYETDDELVEGLVPFVADGIERDERVVVVVGAGTGSKLRRQLGSSADFDLWDASDVYTSPVRTLAAYVDTVVASTEHGRRIRVAGEPLWIGRSPVEQAEWTCVEAACNVVFAESNLEMLCPYNIDGLDPLIIAAAQRTHPKVHRGSRLTPSSEFAPVNHQSKVRAGALPSRPEVFEQMPVFSAADFSPAVSFVERSARARGMAVPRVADLTVAVREVIENAIDCGSAPASVRVWTTVEDLVCEVEGLSRFTSPFAGYLPPTTVAPDDGLWSAGQSCDLIAVRQRDGYCTVRMQFSDYLIAARPECVGIDQLLGVYVLGSCDAEESASVKAHLPTCLACQAEVDRLAHVLHRTAGRAAHDEAGA